MNIRLRAACDEDFVFARSVYFETMRWLIERLFGWEQAREEKNFADFFKLGEVRIITADGRDVGWIQELMEGDEIFIGSFYISSAMQRRGIGTQVLRELMAKARNQSKAITLAVIKINRRFTFTKSTDFELLMRTNTSSI